MTVGWRTLDVGEKALVYSHEGHARVEEGPKRLFLWRETYTHLQRVAATQTEYLEICYKDGNKEHRKGPCVEFRNPVKHTSMRKRDMEALDANEALVVYSCSTDSMVKNSSTRRLEYGPTLFMPKPNEWLHKFVWHGIDPANKTRFIPESDKFSKMRIIPDQFYYNVDEIRTSDDALVRVKLMMFYELQNVEKMLDATVDPIADFINCLCADVIDYASKKTYLEFIEQAGELSDLEHYPRLVARCSEIGYGVSKVVFRGYFAHDKLQEMHNVSIAKRTQLKLLYEREEQEQALVDSKLNAEVSRMEQEQKIAIEALEHRQQMEKDQLTHKLRMEKEEHQQSLQNKKQTHEAELKARELTEQQKVSHLSGLRQLGVDLNQVLAAQAQRPGEVVHVVSGPTQNPTLHLHYT